MVEWLEKGGQVGIYDATNSTNERRALVSDRCRQHGCSVMFIESICEDPAIIDQNILETKVTSPDYVGMDSNEALRDFKERIKHYEQSYETITDEAVPFIKLFDVGRKVVTNRISGYLPTRVVFFLMNLHIQPRPIWITRHGESEFNELGRIGGDSNLTSRGAEYAQKLAGWLTTALPADRPAAELSILTSTLRRAIETAAHLPPAANRVELRSLDEIDAGQCDGLTYDEIAERMPDEYAARAANKLTYRYPRGESYEDVIQRLEPIIFELERQRKPVLVISHQAVIRCLVAYFLDKPPEECPYVPIPLHTVIQLTPKAYGTHEQHFKLMEGGY